MAEETIPRKLEVTDELIAERRSEEPGKTPADMAAWIRPIVGWFDQSSLWVGRITCHMLIPIIFVLVSEFESRKLFNSPTDYSYEHSRMLASSIFMMGTAYALMRSVHIRADFIYRTWTKERQATVDAVFYMALYFPAMVFFAM